MILIGLSGRAGHGKDTIADILVEDFEFIKFSMSDALYREVSGSFSVDEDLLRDRSRKETPLKALTAASCIDKGFLSVLMDEGFEPCEPISPRVILQLWGTEYRRKLFGENYWINRTREALTLSMERAIEDIFRGTRSSIPGFVNTSIRFENEADWIRKNGGLIWRVIRPCATIPEAGHVSEKLPGLLPHDRVIKNGGSLADLRTAVHLVMQGAQVVDTTPDE